MAYAAVISVKKTIENLTNSPRISLVPPSLQIVEFAYKELNTLQEILQRLDKSRKSHGRKKVNALDVRIKDSVWKFEDLLESHVYAQILPQSEILGGGGSGSGGGTLLQVNLQELRDEVDSFIKMLKEKEEEYIYELDNPLPEEEEAAFDGAAVSSTTDFDANKFKVIGSSDLLRKLRVKLQPHWGFAVLPIFGMGGIGKTSLAKQLVYDPLNELEFDCRAWVMIGRKCKLDKLKRDILIQLDPSMDPKIAQGDEGHYLKEILKTKRCLVVLDDVWDTDVWDHLKTSLPDFEGARSRVVLTTRLKDVARYVDQRWHAVVYTVELLNKDESWDLLREKVFGEEDCPPQFHKAGKKIAEKCDGLPLMIVTVADLLSKADDKSAEYWEKVAESKNSSIFMAAYDKTSEVLFPSYEYLPQHLKPCFLHMGVFPQNYEISQFKLLSMWIAEGFLKLETEETVEKCSQRCLAELTNHSVVIRCQISSTFPYEYGDDIKTCRLQSSFWHLCNKEATNNMFFRVLSSRADGFQESLKNQRRLSFHNNILLGMNDVFDLVEDQCASTARSLVCYGPYYPYQVPVLFNLKLLKVLDALQIRFYEFPLQALQQVYLRYLALTCNGELPASISKLWNLQFLIIERNMRIKSSGVTSYLPEEIWDMKEVKHIQVMGNNLPNPSSVVSSENLLTLKGVGAETCTKEVLDRIPNVRKLKVEIELHPNDSMNALHCLNHVHVLSELVSLKCMVVNPKLRHEIVGVPAPLSMFPESLTKLHLSGLGYPWKYMNIIGSLPNLEVLKLRCYAFRGPKWEVKRGIFSTLRYLLIEGTDLVQFRVKKNAFPWLGSLCFKHCYKLQHLRWESWCYPTKVEVIDCSTSTVNFANNEMRSKGEYSPRKPEDVSVQSSWEDGKLK